MGKKWHPQTFTDTCWKLMETEQWMWAQWGSGWCVSVVVTATVATSTGADCYECSMQALVYCWQKCIANGHVCIKKWYFVAENLLYQTVLLCSLYLLKFLLEINRRHYFQSNLRTFFVKTIEECFHRITDPHASLASPSTSQFSVVNTYFCSYIWC